MYIAVSSWRWLGYGLRAAWMTSAGTGPGVSDGGGTCTHHQVDCDRTGHQFSSRFSAMGLVNLWRIPHPWIYMEAY